jgi:hypothetical protein
MRANLSVDHRSDLPAFQAGLEGAPSLGSGNTRHRFIDFRSPGSSMACREKYIEFLKLREIAPIYTLKLREFPDQILASQDFSRTPQRPEQNKPGAPMADRVGHTSEGCLFVLELRFNCKSFFQPSWLAIIINPRRRSPSAVRLVHAPESRER